MLGYDPEGMVAEPLTLPIRQALVFEKSSSPEQEIGGVLVCSQVRVGRPQPRRCSGPEP